MPKPTPEEVLKRFRELPDDLQEAIFSAETADVIQALGKKYKLTIDKIGELADEVGYLMLGFINPKDFLSAIQKRLAVDFDVARAITEDLNVQIFGKIRESLKHARMQEENYVVPLPPPPPPPTPVTPQEKPATPFESKLEDKVFSAQKELSEAREKKLYPGGEDPYREPTN